MKSRIVFLVTSQQPHYKDLYFETVDEALKVAILSDDQIIPMIEKSAYDKAIERLKKTQPALKVAFEDTCDYYYMNVLNDIDELLKELGEL